MDIAASQPCYEPMVGLCDLPPWNVSISRVRIWDTSKGDGMSRKRYTAEQIIGHLRQAEIRTSEGKTIAEAVRELGISEQTYYRWRKQYGGMEVNQARRLKELEQENGRLKRLVADQALDLSIHTVTSKASMVSSEMNYLTVRSFRVCRRQKC